MPEFYIQINDKGGNHFRKYTKDSLQMLFDTTPTAANFELMVLIEGMVYLTYRIYCVINKIEWLYDDYISNRRISSLNNTIELIHALKLIDKSLRDKLHLYRTKRNNIAHDLYRLKTLNTQIKNLALWKDFSYSEALQDMFKMGLDIFLTLGHIVTPNNTDYMYRFKRK